MKNNELSAEPLAKKTRLSTWLFNPFQYVAGWPSLAIGMAVLALVSLIASAAQVHFDGVLDVHVGALAPWWVFWAENHLDWVVMALLALLSGKLFSKSRVRTVDILGTQALARIPTLLIALLMCLPGVKSANTALAQLAQSPDAAANLQALMGFLAEAGVTALDGIQFAVALMLTIVLTIWMVVLMYRAWATACNFSGGKAVAGFVGLLLLAEIVSKILIVGGLAAGSSEPLTPETRAERSQAAIEFVDCLTTGEFGNAEACFDATMQKALPEAKLSATWAGITGQIGAFRSRGEATVKKERGFVVVYIPCTFEKGALKAKVVYDKAGRVSGLWFK